MAPPATRKAEPRLGESKGGVGRQMIEGAGESRKQSRRRLRFGASRRCDDVSRDSDGPVGLSWRRGAADPPRRMSDSASLESMELRGAAVHRSLDAASP
jgi:hypothetical protein